VLQHDAGALARAARRRHRPDLLGEHEPVQHHDVLGQQAVAGRSQAAQPQTSLTGHRDAALMGSAVSRRAGGEPELLPDGATCVRLAV